MPARDFALRALQDVTAAFGLLTRIPVPFLAPPRSGAAWAWPVVGAGIAGIGAGVAGLFTALGLPPIPAAGLALATTAVLTGALHEDGLADSADGLFGGHTKNRRLEIMKDSSIGSFGALALVLVTLIRCSALGAIIATGNWGMIVVAGALSRAPMAAIMAVLPNARGSGLSQTVGQPSRQAAALAAAVSLAIAVAVAGVAGLQMAVVVVAVSLAVAAIARRKIGGQTGDILGAAQQLSEMAALCVAAAVISIAG